MRCLIEFIFIYLIILTINLYNFLYLWHLNKFYKIKTKGKIKLKNTGELNLYYNM